MFDREQLLRKEGLNISSQLPSALEEWPPISNRLSNKSLLLCLDYDGTLTPIVKDPDAAVLGSEMRDLLSELSQLSTVAIISGRDRTKIERFVGLPGIFYAGSHGLDIATPDGSTMQPSGVDSFLDDLKEGHSILKKELENIAGAIVERKQFAITVHYRNVELSDLPHIDRAVSTAMEHTFGLHVEKGKKIFELKPVLDWNKGSALTWIHKYISNGRESLPIYIGDDVTDEAAFKEIHKSRSGLGVLVGNTSYPTFAQYKLNGVNHAQVFLTKLRDYLTLQSGADSSDE